MSRVLDIRASVEELIQIEIRGELRVAWQIGIETSLEVVELLGGRNARHTQITVLLLTSWAKHLVELHADALIRQFRFQVAFAIERSRFYETLGLVVGHFQQDTISGDLHFIVDFKDIANLEIS